MEATQHEFDRKSPSDASNSCELGIYSDIGNPVCNGLSAVIPASRP